MEASPSWASALRSSSWGSGAIRESRCSPGVLSRRSTRRETRRRSAASAGAATSARSSPARNPPLPNHDHRRRRASRLAGSSLSRDQRASTATERTLALELPAPICAVFDFHPASLAGQVGLVHSLRDQPLELVL